MADDVPAPGGETGDPDPGDAEPDVPEPVVPGPAPETAPVTPVVTLEDAPVPLAAQVLDTTEVPAAMPVAAVAPQADLEAEEVVQIEDEEVPLADGGEVKETEDEEEPETESESVILEDEETPLAAKPGRNWTLLSIIPAALAAAFIILILLRRKKEEEEEA